MTAKEKLKWLIDDAGLDEATAKAILENEKMQSKAGKFVQQEEYSELERKAAELELAYNGTKDKPGSKAYADWYQANFPTIKAYEVALAQYKERYGDLTAAPAPDKAKPQGGTLTQEDIDKRVNEVIQQNYAPRWSDLLTNTGSIVQKHMRAGRKSDIDFKKLSEIAQTKGGDLMAAYDEYDAPERQAAEKAATDAEIDRRVSEKLKAAQTNQFFPAGADATPSGSGSTSPLSRAKVESPKYDRSKVIEAAVTGKYETQVQ
jgi:hypothetical protein